MTATDSIDIDIRLLPVLDEKTLEGMIHEELEKRGWTRNADGSLSKEIGEAKATLPAGSSTITVAIERETSVSAEATETALADEKNDAAVKAIADRAQKKAEQKLATAQRSAELDLKKRNAQALLDAEPQVQEDVSAAINSVTKRALEQRARSLGEIESMNENQGEEGYELTITVRT